MGLSRGGSKMPEPERKESKEEMQRLIDGMFPTAQTCFFDLTLPAYSSDAIMRQRLLTVINLESWDNAVEDASSAEVSAPVGSPDGAAGEGEKSGDQHEPTTSSGSSSASSSTPSSTPSRKKAHRRSKKKKRKQDGH